MAPPRKPVSVRTAVHDHLDVLTRAERQVATVVLDDLESVAFSTVAQVAARAGVSGPSVVRLANRLGFDGFVGLQAAARDELRGRLRTGEMVQAPATDPLAAVVESGVENLRTTFDRIDRREFDKVGKLLADPDRTVWIIAGERLRATAATLFGFLWTVRERVELIEGNDYKVGTGLRAIERGDAVVVLDSTPPETWLVPMVERAAARRAVVVALLADGLHPAAGHAKHVLSFTVRSASVFHSQVAAMGLVEALCYDVARRDPTTTGRRLGELVEWWTGEGLIDPT